MNFRNFAKLGLVVFIAGAASAPVMADNALGEWRYNSVNYGYGRPANWAAEHEQHRAMRNGADAIEDLFHGDIRDAGERAFRSYESERRANVDRRIGNDYYYGY